MPRQKKLGSNAPMPNFGNFPQDPTRAVQSQSYPPDQSVYSTPITTNQVSSTSRTPSTGQMGNPDMSLSSPNSLPTQVVPQTTMGVNPSNNS